MVNQKELDSMYIEHKLQIIRIVIDKLLIGVIVVIFGFFANCIIENYKNKNVQKTFILQKKYESAMEIRNKISQISNDVFELVSWSYVLDIPNKILAKKIESNLHDLIDIYNTESFLFDQETDKDFSQVISILLGLVSRPELAERNSRSFVNELFDYLTYKLRIQVDKSSTPEYKGYIPIKKTNEEIDDMGSVKYFKINYDLYCSKL